ncbi:MAG: winged helix-turn-helix domain-containing protein [Nanoarchaeota archaeon]
MVLNFRNTAPLSTEANTSRYSDLVVLPDINMCIYLFINVFIKLNLIQKLKNYGLPDLKVSLFGSGFNVFVDSKDYKKTVQKTTQKETLTELELKILEVIKKNNRLTRENIAKILNISPNTVKEYLAKLKNKNIIDRLGGRKTGYWKVLK